VNKLRSTK